MMMLLTFIATILLTTGHLFSSSMLSFPTQIKNTSTVVIDTPVETALTSTSTTHYPKTAPLQNTDTKKPTKPIRSVASSTQATSSSPRLDSVLRSGFATIQNNMYFNVDTLFSSPGSDDPQLALPVPLPAQSVISSGRIEVENRLSAMQAMLSGISTTTSTTTLLATTATFKQDLGEIRLFLDNLNISLSALPSSTSTSQAQKIVADAHTILTTTTLSIFAAENIVLGLPSVQP